jgi:hypothetical protein
MRLADKALVGAGLGLLAALAWMASRGAGSAGSAIGGAAVDLVDGIVSGAVIGAGEIVGLPATECGACNRAMDEYDAASWYEKALVSFSVSANCTAKDYFKWLADVNYRPSCK